MKYTARQLEAQLELNPSTLIDMKGKSSPRHKTAGEAISRKTRAAALQKFRMQELGLSQSELAKSVGANLRTLQAWESGRQEYPASVELLMTLMKEFPDVRKRLTGK